MTKILPQIYIEKYSLAKGYVSSLAPNKYNKGFFANNPIVIKMQLQIISIAKEFPIIFSALLSSPLPLAIEQSGAPPMPNKLVNAVISIIIGKVMPSPVNANVEFCAKCPIYILSTKLYKTFINCATVIGIARLIIL